MSEDTSPTPEQSDQSAEEERPPQGTETTPRGNQEAEPDEVERGQEKLDQISGN